MKHTRDVIYLNGNIWTGVAGAPRAEALAVRGEEILAVGSGDEVSALCGPQARVVDLKGRSVVPGFIDSHTHFISGGLQLTSVDLRDAQSRREFVRRIGKFAKGLKEGRWITGGDWDHEAWGGELPHRDWIDTVTPDVPVFVNRLDGHMALANSRALERAGITMETPDPDGGTIMRDPVTGQPTGILKDEAMALVYATIPAPTEKELDEALERAMDHAVAQGITQIHDMGTWSHLETLRRAARKETLKLRVYSFVPLSTWPQLGQYIDMYGQGGNWHRWGGLKGFVDGSLGSTTAWFYQPYDDAPQTHGLVVTDTSVLRSWIERGDALGLQVAVHAIGDQANDWLLDTYASISAKNGSRDRRFRIEHAQHLTNNAIERFRHQGVVPAMQPYHAIDDGRWAEKRIGPERIKTTYAFRALLDAGASVCFGSDWTVAPISPLEGIYAAVTRRTLDGLNPEGWVPAEKITVAEALRCYTLHSARSGFMEDRTGTLEPGKLADFVVLSQDLFTIDPVDIPQAQIFMTIVGGKVQYQVDDH
ncbi:MAG: amidohydrolase [Fidelibacterota bacterium]|nr:MAG: amidohydrolase [Candidatus Neomarinimicrobiota bacterium]